MVENDVRYFGRVLATGLVKGPFLEVGSAKVLGEAVPNLCEVAARSGISPTLGADIAAGDGVDVVADFSLPFPDFSDRWQHGRFNSVAVFNVLEHTFDPAVVLENALHCLNPGGVLLVIAPSVWNIHEHPRDFVRLLPDWFEEFGRRRRLTIVPDFFCFVSSFGITPVDSPGRRNRELPSFLNEGRSRAPVRYWRSRILHKLFNTFGRDHGFTTCTVACTYLLAD